MPQRFRIEVPKGEDLTTFMKDLKSDPDMKLISQEDLGDRVAIIYEDTVAPDLQESGGGTGAASASSGGGAGTSGGGGAGTSSGGSAGSSGSGGETAVPGTVGPFSNDEWNTYCSVLGKRESGNNYSIVNSLGFSGRWQFGRLALIDGGYVKSGGSGGGAPAAASSWTGKDGIASRANWLASKAVQDAAMVVYTQSHYKSFLKNGGLKTNSSKARVAGLLAASHLMGVGGAMKMISGDVMIDANGTTTTSYYKLLSEAFGGTGKLEA